MPKSMLSKAIVTLSLLVFASAGQGMVRKVQRMTRKINCVGVSNPDMNSFTHYQTAAALNWLPNKPSGRPYVNSDTTVVSPTATETSPARLDEPTPVEASPLERPINFEIAKGLQEGLITELITFAFNDQSFSYAGPEGIHHAVKSLVLDMSTNAFTALSTISKSAGSITGPGVGSFAKPLSNLQDPTASENTDPHSATLAAVRFGLLFVRCVVAPLLVHGMAHVVPTAAVQFVVENAKLMEGLSLVQ